MAAKSSNNRLIFILAVTILLIFLHLISFTGPIEGFIQKGVSVAVRPILGLREAINQISGGGEGNKDALVDKARLFELEQENKELKKLLKFSEQQSYDYVASRLIGQTVDGHSNVMLLDKGEQDGIKVGYAVVIDGGVLIGKIIKVGEAVSYLLILTDSRSKVTATLQNEDLTPGILVGDRGLGINLELIPQNLTVAAGDLVVTSGLEPAIPQGLIIGQVESVLVEGNTLFQKAAVEPVRSYIGITKMLILIPPSEFDNLIV